MAEEKSVEPKPRAKPKLADALHCTGCSACMFVCPHHAIQMATDEMMGTFPHIHDELCRRCGLCQRVCPLSHPGNAAMPLHYLAAWNQDSDVRKTSSSGGIFSLLAEQVIQRGGVVVGCTLEGTPLQAKHICITDTAEIGRLRGSKYTQSDMTDIYKNVQRYAKRGRLLLLSGTPCQIAALRRVLGARENVITLDFICHGVPPAQLFTTYQKHLKAKIGPLVSASFRDKSISWRKFSMSARGKAGQVYVASRKEDPYLRAFLADYSLRSGCYRCALREGRSGADITLSDYWGYRQKGEEDREEKLGVSAVAINTEAGARLWESVSRQCATAPLTRAQFITGNESYYTSPTEPDARKKFFRYVRKYPLPTAFYAARHSLLAAFFHWLVDTIKATIVYHRS